MTDNNFNAMIEPEDIDDSIHLNEKWIFDFGETDCFKDENNTIVYHLLK